MVERFGLFPVRSPLLGESRLLSFPEGTEMFHFPSFTSLGYVLFRAMGGMNLHGLPHSEIPGSMPVSGSPRLFAAIHVLHRLSTPRHPSHALTSLTITVSSLKEAPALVDKPPGPRIWSEFKTRTGTVSVLYTHDSFGHPNASSSFLPIFKEPTAKSFKHALHGADRARTDDIQLAKLALSQLSYSPETLHA